MKFPFTTVGLESFRALVVVILILFGSNTFAGPNPASATLTGTPMTFLNFTNLAIGQSYQMQHTIAWYWTNLPTSLTATNAVYSQMITGVVSGADYRLAQIPVPTQAFAVAQTSGGFVAGANVTAGGSGYVAAPTVSIVSTFHSGGSNATATASVSNGAVSSVTITGFGFGYTNTPIVEISPPPAVTISPSAQAVLRLSFPSDHIGWRVQYSSGIDASWQTISGSSQTNQINFFITNDIYLFRMIYP